MKTQHAPLYGLVLAGGKSLRMGEDKAAFRYHGKMQSEHCLQLLGAFCEKVFISIRKEQADENAFKGFTHIYDRTGPICPLNGILSAMEAHPAAAWLVLGCDLPFVDRNVLHLLIESRDPSQQATAFQRKDDQIPEPMCAIYEPTMLTIFNKMIEKGQRSPRRGLEGNHVRLIDPLDPEALINVNTQAERKKVEASIHG